jgi:hypothetical protein
MMVVLNVGAEEQHAAIVFSNLRKAEHLGEKLARALEISDLEHKVPDSFDFERHGMVLLHRRGPLILPIG